MYSGGITAVSLVGTDVLDLSRSGICEPGGIRQVKKNCGRVSAPVTQSSVLKNDDAASRGGGLGG